MNKTKTLFALLLALLALTLAACGGEGPKSAAFPGIDSACIPEALEASVGRLGDVSFTSGIQDGDGYTAVLAASFEDTDPADYDTLMQHYTGFSTTTGGDGTLYFDWGWLTLAQDDGNKIVLHAYFL